MTPEERAAQILEKLELGPSFFGGNIESEMVGYKHELKLVKEAIEAHSAELQAENDELKARYNLLNQKTVMKNKTLGKLQIKNKTPL